MADYFTHFSCMFDVGSADNATAAEAIRRRQADELDVAEGRDFGFEMEIDTARGPGALWISSDGYGEPEHVIAFVLACAETFDLTGRWGFTWALTCSKPRLAGARPRCPQKPRLDGLRSMADRHDRPRDRPRQGRHLRLNHFFKSTKHGPPHGGPSSFQEIPR